MGRKGEKEADWGEKVRNPFPRFRTFLPPPPLPFLHLLRRLDRVMKFSVKTSITWVGSVVQSSKFCIHLLLVVFAESNSRYTFTDLTLLDHEQCPIFLLRSSRE